MYERFEFREKVTWPVARELLHRIAANRTTLSPRVVDKPLALYGAGNLGRMAREYLHRLGVPVEFFIDVNAIYLREDPYWAGVRLLSPEEVSADLRENLLLAVCVVTSPYGELARHLQEAGWNDVVPFYDIAEGFRHRHPLSNGWFASPLTPSEITRMETVLHAWSDNTSRAHHLQFIAWRRLRQEWLFDTVPITPDDRFFIPEVMAALTDNESFADVGAHVGSVTKRFINATGGRFRHIWAIEPDGKNLAELNATVAKEEPEVGRRVEIIPAVIASDSHGRRFLDGLGYASQCCDLGALFPSRTLDELGLTPTYIKLHLEGMELDVLRGAIATITRYRPIIAATCYHNADGLYRMPSWLMDNLDGYHFYFRQHSWCSTGSVVYCLPGNVGTSGMKSIGETA
uniref:Methyltransferase, FkbM family n=1 Tax=Candidatus Kentrum sp. LFY TaxID=2126342 RepID=A0A450UHW2_9GAMM|nr:MAG: methyltransferase, FkbM family [Candidatus Kentron sp. LFY]